MSLRMPHQALSLMANTSAISAQCGLRVAAVRAASRANPVLMTIESAGAVLNAIDSWIELKRAIRIRDGLAHEIALESERLARERAVLAQCIKEARLSLQTQRKVRAQIHALSIACAQAWATAWDELYRMRQADLPDCRAFEHLLPLLDDSWRRFQQAISLYTDEGT